MNIYLNLKDIIRFAYHPGNPIFRKHVKEFEEFKGCDGFFLHYPEDEVKDYCFPEDNKFLELMCKMYNWNINEVIIKKGEN